MKRRYYKSDFDFLLHITDAQGNRIGWPDFDWHARIWTASPNVYFEAGCHGGQCLNCFNDNGRIHIVAKDHRLPPGVLSVEFAADLPDEIYLDGTRMEVTASPVRIKLTRVAPAKNSTRLTADLSLPIYRSSTSGAQPGPIVLQRGMIPLGAKPGVVYRNLGYIKLPTRAKGNSQGLSGDVDVSGVDLDFVTEAVAFEMEHGVHVTLDRQTKVVHYECDANYSHGATAGVRLCLITKDESPSNYGGDYIMRCADGLIRPVYNVNGFTPIDPVLPAPVIHSGLYGGHKYLGEPSIRGLVAALLGRTKPEQQMSTVQIQIKVGRRKRRRFPHKKKWVKITRPGVSRDRRSIGIVRVRYVRRCDKSSWSVFSFVYNKKPNGRNFGLWYVTPLI